MSKARPIGPIGQIGQIKMTNDEGRPFCHPGSNPGSSLKDKDMDPGPAYRQAGEVLAKEVAKAGVQIERHGFRVKPGMTERE